MGVFVVGPAVQRMARTVKVALAAKRRIGMRMDPRWVKERVRAESTEGSA
jgi:hypothetical protein